MTTCPVCKQSVLVAWGDGCERCLAVEESEEARRERLADKRADAAVDAWNDEH